MNATQVNEIIECLNQSTGMTFSALSRLDTLHFTDFKGRLHISGGVNGLAKYMPYRAVHPSISADSRRTSAAIARDIQRRLLPEYRALLDTCAMNKLADDEYKGRKRALSDSLCKTGMARQLDWATNDDTITLVDTGIIKGFDFRAVINDNSIHFEHLDLSADLALKVFAMLAHESKQAER